MGDQIESLRGKGSQVINNYLNFLELEILSIKHKSSLSTIYIGGGTPSVLNPKQIEKIIKIFGKHYGIDHGAEITMEVDPASFDESNLHGFIDAGVNRFSLGAQSFNNLILKNAGRRHTSKDVENACYWLMKAHNENLINSWSLDLIQNLPESLIFNWKNDLKQTISFNPPHISIYDLIVEEGTVFQKLQDKGKLFLPNQDQSFANSMLTSRMLRDAGYSRYEISNYSLPGHQSRHNRVYWQGMGWWSFGQGSTSSPWGLRFTRPENIEEYKKWVTDQSECGLEKSLLKSSNKNLDLDEKIMLGLRLREGINIKKLLIDEGWDENKIVKELKKLLSILDHYRKSNLLLNEGDRFYLSDPKGMELSNQIIISMFNWLEKIN
tara:strand:+ start:6399 stop:7538 length:1140 start_codon:yes stop_codon:yes gene_type:complete